MKISASLYSAKQQDLPSLVHELDELKLDYFHIDCFDKDAEKVAKDITAIKSISNTPIDLHVISNDIQKFVSFANEWGVSQLCFQYENLEKGFKLPANNNYKLGLALTNTTDLEVVEPYKNSLDYILLMTTTPGKSGGTFEKSSFERIRKCRALFPNTPIYVDGGINAEVSFILRLLGVSMAVSGSFLVNNNNTAVALSDLRFHQKGSYYLIKDFMLNLDKLPILEMENANFKQAVEAIEQYKMGVVLFTKNGALEGISSNADLRKGLLKNMQNLNNIKLADIINPFPKTIKESNTTYEMLSFIKKSNIPLLFLPVVDNNNKLKGMITFNELIKGEG